MKPIKIKVTEADALVVQAPTITSGMTGLTVAFEFDETWDGFTKTAVFKAGDVVRDVVDIDASCTVPPEVLEQPYRILRIGVYGVSADGEVTIPTVWATLDEIRLGTDPSGDESTDPTLPVWQQILNKMGTVKTVNGTAPDENGDVEDVYVIHATGSVAMADSGFENSVEVEAQTIFDSEKVTRYLETGRRVCLVVHDDIGALFTLDITFKMSDRRFFGTGAGAMTGTYADAWIDVYDDKTSIAIFQYSYRDQSELTKMYGPGILNVHFTTTGYFSDSSGDATCKTEYHEIASAIKDGKLVVAHISDTSEHGEGENVYKEKKKFQIVGASLLDDYGIQIGSIIYTPDSLYL